MPSSRPGSLFPLYLAVFVAVLGFSLIAPFFPGFVMDMGASYFMLGIIVSVYGAVQLLTQIPIGRLSDRTGRRKIMLLGLTSFTLMPLLYIWATGPFSLLFIRALGGLGASAVWPIAMALIVDRADAGGRGEAMGWYNASFFSALALGPWIGGVLYDWSGPKAPFLLWALLGAVSFFVVLLRVAEPEKIKLQIGDIPSRREGDLICTGYRMTFLACSAVVLWSGIVGGFNFTMLPGYAAGLGLKAADVGMIYLVYGSSTALFNIYFGRQADRGGRKRLIFAGCLAGAVGFALLPMAGGLAQAALLFALLGMGLGMAGPAAAALIADTTSAARRGEVYGIFNTARMAGVVIGPLIAGFAADRHGIGGAVYAFIILAAAITLASLTIQESKGKTIEMVINKKN
jgi:DHA1 family multidrug resistance protein-like MFS transporter